MVIHFCLKKKSVKGFTFLKKINNVLVKNFVLVNLNREKLCPSEGGDEAFIRISRNYMINESRDSVGEIPSP